MKILIVEDDPVSQRLLEKIVRREGYDTITATNGKGAWKIVKKEKVKLVITDWMMPEMDGLKLCRKIRQANLSRYVYIILLTARDQAEDAVAALDAGADDYLVKPFAFAELYARLRALSRRKRGAASETINYKNIKIDTTSHTVELNEQTVVLSRREFSLLVELITNQGRVLSRHYLEQKLYSWSDEVESNTIEVYIHHLRKKFYTDLIKTVRGIGYIIAKE